MNLNGITFRPLSYVDALSSRTSDAIVGVVIHCTELPDLATAREYGEVIHYAGSGSGNSGHYYIDRDGHTECWVPPERVAHHTRGFNETTVGIELVNRGRFPDWFDTNTQDQVEAYPESQVSALIELLTALTGHFPPLQWMAGHEDLDREQVPASDDPTREVRRKRDPGPGFPWNEVTSAVRLERRRQPR